MSYIADCQLAGQGSDKSANTCYEMSGGDNVTCDVWLVTSAHSQHAIPSPALRHSQLNFIAPIWKCGARGVKTEATGVIQTDDCGRTWARDDNTLQTDIYFLLMQFNCF